MSYSAFSRLILLCLPLVFAANASAQTSAKKSRHHVESDEPKSPEDYLKMSPAPQPKQSRDANSANGEKPAPADALPQAKSKPMPETPVGQALLTLMEKEFGFTAEATPAGEVIFHWHDMGEEIADSYVILRRIPPAGEWEVLAGVKAQPAQDDKDAEYVFSDSNPPKGQVQYMVKWLGFDKKYTTSKAVTLKI